MDEVSCRISKRTAWGGPSEYFFLPPLIPHLLITASPQDHSSKTAFLSIPPERAGTELTLSIRPVSLYSNVVQRQPGSLDLGLRGDSQGPAHMPASHCK